MTNQFTVVEYLYRDAGNYKTRGTILVAGSFSNDEINLVQNCLYDREFFIPEEVCLPPLQHQLWDIYGENDDDHEWHSVEKIRPATQRDMTLPIWGTKEVLLHNFKSVGERLARRGF